MKLICRRSKSSQSLWSKLSGYKKFNLNFNAGGAGGYMIYNNTPTNITNISGILRGRNVDKAAYNSAEKTVSAVAASTRFLENGNYLKLRNVMFAIVLETLVSM